MFGVLPNPALEMSLYDKLLDYDRTIRLFKIFKDYDNLDRVRLGDLNVGPGMVGMAFIGHGGFIKFSFSVLS